MNDKDHKNFWKSLNNKYKGLPQSKICIEGSYDDKSISNKFMDHFSKIFVDSKLNLEAYDEFTESSRLHTGDSLNLDDITTDLIDACINDLKPFKAAAQDGITSEHLLYANSYLSNHLRILFVNMIKHAYVPNSFGKGLIIPIPKDKSNLNSVDNYRPITLSPMTSKIFELLLIKLLDKYLLTDPLQFGFKKGLGCRYAIFALRQVVQYFNCRHSNVSVASLDASKAFDRVNHYKLFSLLMLRKIPVCVIRTLFEWYSKLFVTVKWNCAFSYYVKVNSGVRQGGILSPSLFNIYIDVLIVRLRKMNFGCHIDNIFLGCLCYADDILLISPSVSALQMMLNICDDVGKELAITFNPMKSSCIMFGSGYAKYNPSSMTLSNSEISWVKNLKYLGIIIKTGKVFDIDIYQSRRKFYASVNSILERRKYASEIVKVEIFEKQCLPILLYSVESLNLSREILHSISVAVNSVYRKNFHYHRWESVKSLMFYLGNMDVKHCVDKKILLFYKNMKSVAQSNPVVNKLLNVIQMNSELADIENLYNISVYSPAGAICRSVSDHFQSIVEGNLLL